MRFQKYQGLGNDFVLLDDRDRSAPTDAKTVRRICDRHFGIGADGILYIRPGVDSDASMKVMNSDGSEPEMCGNGIRCVAKYLYDNNIVRKKEMTISTLAGNKTAKIIGDDVEINMGEPKLNCEDIPMDRKGKFINKTMDVNGRKIAFNAVSMGNPHFITFDELTDDEIERLGPVIGIHPIFPNRTNVEFARVSNGRINIKVYERGAGWTLACGTGACATTVAAALNDLVPYDKAVDVHLPGGTLKVTVDRYLRYVMMAGPAEKVYEGTLVI